MVCLVIIMKEKHIFTENNIVFTLRIKIINDMFEGKYVDSVNCVVENEILVVDIKDLG